MYVHNVQNHILLHHRVYSLAFCQGLEMRGASVVVYACMRSFVVYACMYPLVRLLSVVMTEKVLLTMYCRQMALMGHV